jgi:CheY-like chemotaxis protein
MMKIVEYNVTSLKKVNQTNILIIDDIEAIRNFISLVFKRIGYEFVETADSADSADSAEVALEKSNMFF